MVILVWQALFLKKILADLNFLGMVRV
jgi:hypothetical protein